MNFLNDRSMMELLSGLGAGMIGGAIGVYFSHHLRRIVLPIFLLGILFHAVGMWGTKHIENAGGELSQLARILYVACWVLLAGLLSYGFYLAKRNKDHEPS